MTQQYNEDEFQSTERPNKSQLKRDAQSLQELVKKLSELNEEKWIGLSLPDEVLEELRLLNDIKQFGAKNRQVKHIAKMLRHVDVKDAKAVVASVSSERVADNVSFHRVERWRERLLSEDTQALTEFLSQYSGADSQRLHQLIRNAKREAATNATSKSSKLLFKMLRGLVG